MATAGHGKRREGENSVPRHDDDQEQPTTTEIIDELGEGILELGGYNKDSLALITCLNLLGNLRDAIKREVERKAQTVLGQKIDHLTSICKDIQKTTTTEERQTTKPLYAEVAATRVPLPRPILRTRIDDSNTTPPAQLLTDVKKTYNHAIAVHRLPSGDVDIRFDTQAHRDAAAGAPSPPGFTVFNKQYLVEIPGVPLIV